YCSITSNIIFLGNNAFENCTGLKNITIYDTIAYIGSDAFKGCGFKNFEYKGTKAQWEKVIESRKIFSYKVTIQCTDGTIVSND
ncbi:MAG: leucine-rich repeat domain-containing protein, partial [Anaeroplasma bactoclasticum]|nr:leucine-rich repeat domain-containing protein [Anaeroplasma bactoclasticum]